MLQKKGEVVEVGPAAAVHCRAFMKVRSHGSRGWHSNRWTGITALVIVVFVLAILFKLQSLVPELNSQHPVTSTGNKELPAFKVAFLFLVRHQMPLDFVWEHFFQVQIHASTQI